MNIIKQLRATHDTHVIIDNDNEIYHYSKQYSIALWQHTKAAAEVLWNATMLLCRAKYAPDKQTNKETNATIWRNIYHMIGRIQDVLMLLFNETTVKGVELKDLKTFVFVERNMVQRHSLEIRLGKPAWNRTDGCTKHLSSQFYFLPTLVVCFLSFVVCFRAWEAVLKSCGAATVGERPLKGSAMRGRGGQQPSCRFEIEKSALYCQGQSLEAAAPPAIRTFPDQ